MRGGGICVTLAQICGLLEAGDRVDGLHEGPAASIYLSI